MGTQSFCGDCLNVSCPVVLDLCMGAQSFCGDCLYASCPVVCGSLVWTFVWVRSPFVGIACMHPVPLFVGHLCIVPLWELLVGIRFLCEPFTWVCWTYVGT